MINKILFALDFDGVICDSAVETAHTAWTAAQDFWPDMQDQTITAKQVQQFRDIRPRLEFGYEALLIIRLLQQGLTTNDLNDHYHERLQSLIKSDGLNIDALKDAFGQTRDRKIQQDETGWIASNPLFDGITAKLSKLQQEDWAIITTKQERFVERILQGNKIHLKSSRIYGLDRNLGKQEVLKRLKIKNPDRPIIFIEDRLPTLIKVLENPDLQDIKMQLADWGYNTEPERKMARENAIEVIGKDDFLVQIKE